MEAIWVRAGLVSRTQAGTAGQDDRPMAHRIAVEELESWYFGEWSAVQAAYPRLPDSIPRSRGFRDPDAISGGTWEAFQRVMQRHGYFAAGLPKIEAGQPGSSPCTQPWWRRHAELHGSSSVRRRCRRLI